MKFQTASNAYKIDRHKIKLNFEKTANLNIFFIIVERTDNQKENILPTKYNQIIKRFDETSK